MSNTDSPNPAAVRRCQQVKIDGVRCGSPAIKNQRLCYFHHMQLLARPENRASIVPYDVYIDIPVLENDASIQVAITHIIRLLLSREVDQRTAALVLYGLQTSAAVARRGPIEPDPAEVVSDFKQLMEFSLDKEDSPGKQASSNAAKPEAVAPSAPESANNPQQKANDNAPAQVPEEPGVKKAPPCSSKKAATGTGLKPIVTSDARRSGAGRVY